MLKNAIKGGQLKIKQDILFFKNYLLGEGPFDKVNNVLTLRDIIRFYRYRNGYFVTLLRLADCLDFFRLGWIPRFFLNFFYGCDISSGCKIGPVYFPHPFGIVIGGKVRVKGPVVIFNDVTMGKSYPGKVQNMPSIGGRVIISCGSRLLGDIEIGSEVVIAANAVVTKSIADSKTYIARENIVEGTYFIGR